MFLFLCVAFGSWRMVTFLLPLGGEEKKNKMSLLKKRPIGLGYGWGREKVTHVSISLCSIFSYQLSTVLSSHLLLTVLRMRVKNPAFQLLRVGKKLYSLLWETLLQTNKNKNNIMGDSSSVLGSFILNYLLVNRSSSCQATFPPTGACHGHEISEHCF